MLHPLEVKAIADGDAAQGIKGMDPMLAGQLTREEIEKAEADPNYRMKISEPKVRVPEVKRRGPRYTPVSKRQDRPNAILWLVRNHPELKDAQIMRLVGTTKPTIQAIRERTHWNSATLHADRSGDARPLLAARARHGGAQGRHGRAAAGRAAGRAPALGRGDDGASAPATQESGSRARRGAPRTTEIDAEFGLRQAEVAEAADEDLTRRSRQRSRPRLRTTAVPSFDFLTDPLFWIAALAAFVAALIRGFSGFGAGLIFMPVAAACLGPKPAAGILFVIDTILILPFVAQARARSSTGARCCRSASARC